MSAVQAGRKTVTTAGTRVQLATSVAVEYVIVQALSGNTNPVEVGDNTVVAAAGTQQGVRLSANDAVRLDVDDLADLWVDSVTNGEGVSYTAITE